MDRSSVQSQLTQVTDTKTAKLSLRFGRGFLDTYSQSSLTFIGVSVGFKKKEQVTSKTTVRDILGIAGKPTLRWTDQERGSIKSGIKKLVGVHLLPCMPTGKRSLAEHANIVQLMTSSQRETANVLQGPCIMVLHTFHTICQSVFADLRGSGGSQVGSMFS